MQRMGRRLTAIAAVAGWIALAGVGHVWAADAASLGLQLEICQSDGRPTAERRAACSALIDAREANDEIRAEALLNRAILSLNAGTPAPAIADLSGAIKLRPEYGALFAYRGEAQAAVGQLDAAVADFDRAIGLDPDNADLLAARGNIHAKRKDRDKARADYKAALAIDATHPVAVEGLKAVDQP